MELSSLSSSGNQSQKSGWGRVVSFPEALNLLGSLSWLSVAAGNFGLPWFPAAGLQALSLSSHGLLSSVSMCSFLRLVKTL